MVETLEALAELKVAELIFENKYKNFEFKLNEYQSNNIFEIIKEWNIKYKNVKQITQKLDITDMVFEEGEFNQEKFNIANAQRLRRVEISDLFAATQFLTQNEENETIADIVRLLRNIINDKYEPTLKTLRINGNGFKFQEDWIKTISCMAPSITSLSLPCCSISSFEFTKLCFNFATLTKLDISWSGVKKLNGIWFLHNLEVLDMISLEFEKSEDVMDLFELKKLRVLNITGEGLSNNLQCYLSCNKVLPELRFLDCSCNVIDSNNLEELVQTHTKLEMVVLFGTALERTPQLEIPDRKIELLTVENIQCCIKSTNYFLKASKVNMDFVRQIFSELYNYMNNSEISDTDFKECCMFYIYVINRWNWDVLRDFAFCNLQIIRSRPHLFDFNEKQRLVQVIVRSLPKYNESEPHHMSTHASAWYILDGQEFYRNSNDTINAICEEAANVVMSCKNLENYTPSFCVYLIYKSLHHIKPEPSSLLIGNHYLKMKLIDGVIIFQTTSMSYFQLFTIIKAVCILTYHDRDNCSSAESIFAAEIFIGSVVGLVDHFCEELMREIFVYLINHYISNIDMSVFKKIFKRDCAEVFLPILLDRQSKEQKNVIYYLLALMKESEARNSGNDDKYCIESEIKEIQTSIESFERIDETDHMEVFRWLCRTSESRDVVRWARWCLKTSGLELLEGEEKVGLGEKEEEDDDEKVSKSNENEQEEDEQPDSKRRRVE
ncbi:hypothetical protein CRE_20486 [Caenorhabditis remanei]|uniref:Uncharacterized protein n=1 Tax=Caenorhabditis remanei TaxID=31234 RepID=E3N2U1_CAERE|nr:hypothetical protein CRE_20486 [Caenorhabditis remanei]